jgi:hypothetical protein
MAKISQPKFDDTKILENPNLQFQTNWFGLKIPLTLLSLEYYKKLQQKWVLWKTAKPAEICVRIY